MKKKILLFKNRAIYLLLFFFLCSNGAWAQMNKIYSDSFSGDFAIIGNTMGQDVAPGVATPTVGTVGFAGFNAFDSAIDVYWQADYPNIGDVTANTSITTANAKTSDILTLPTGAVIKKAYLCWSFKNTTFIDTDVATITLSRNNVFSQSITSDTYIYNGGFHTYYSDITSLINMNGSGSYMVSNMNLQNINNLNDSTMYAGWSITVFYELSSEQYKKFDFYAGYQAISNGVPFTTTFDIQNKIAGESKFGCVAFDGDNTITDDQLLINNVAKNDALNPSNNFFNSSKSYLGTAVSTTGSLPQLTGGANSMSGVDIDIIDIESDIPLGNSSTNISFATTNDVYYLTNFAVSSTYLTTPIVNSTQNFCGTGYTLNDISVTVATGATVHWYDAATGGNEIPLSTSLNQGTVTYYVGQTLSGVASNRVAVNITINPIPSAPTVTTPIIYNQGATASALSVTGSNLLWYTTATGGTGSSTTPIPSTATIGTTSYWVSQTSNGCESARNQIDVIVNSTTPATHLNFDGTNDYVNIPHSPSLLVGTDSFTYEAQVKLNGNGFSLINIL